MAPTNASGLSGSLRSFAASLTKTYGSAIKAQPEDQLKGPVHDLLPLYDPQTGGGLLMAVP